MTDEQPTPTQTTSTLTTFTQSESPRTLSGSEITALLALINTMLTAMEGRIISRLDENSRGATTRWAAHDMELLTNTRRITDRFAEIDRAIANVAASVGLINQREHEKKIVFNGRVQPIRYSIAWMAKNWKNILLIFIGILSALTFATDWLTHLLNIAH